ncbi:adult cuticle protein 1-like [Musca vetustissima]|uniref:adult cuticle protein 1-like n=1 Tax=Musca vetustissima TaxID=27455 RepID=UPI002AB72BE4|nr:adult cuticle protein 1-like [Musca vetustissima]
MKFSAAILSTLALGLGAQASVLPLVTELAGSGLSYTAVSSPVVASPWAPWGHSLVAVPPAAVEVHAPAVVEAPAPAAVAVHAAPSVAVHAPVVVPAAEGTYVAKTRGAVHTAPLAGHVNSVANVNLAPAPGTV